jgi:hypothetical protein
MALCLYRLLSSACKTGTKSYYKRAFAILEIQFDVEHPKTQRVQNRLALLKRRKEFSGFEK